jgi:hypothetical protein
MESTRRFVISGQNDPFFAQNQPFSRENRVIFTCFQRRLVLSDPSLEIKLFSAAG